MNEDNDYLCPVRAKDYRQRKKVLTQSFVLCFLIKFIDLQVSLFAFALSGHYLLLNLFYSALHHTDAFRLSAFFVK
ncbi:hypothetical protein B0A71_06185 [Flavobacterium tructae]|uniref:Uncharacterized protein n=1 Tax=Flavobacterium tructae TaxID=1114873 RepID=A0A1S1JBP6_9FLAO|nr:hypothetical protein BHE19_05005 [Flavobacterium tructae]OXB21172.1 hypothetical protein B0A71_06185 [Flavobacterium tructae]